MVGTHTFIHRGRGASVEHLEVLPPEPASARRARGAIRSVLDRCGRTGWEDAATLAVSEVVTNAALHAHTPLELRVGVFDDTVCVEVRDENPALPVVRHYDAEATTGRGMGLVAAISRACGVESLGAAGKVVWFCIGDEAQDAGEISGMWRAVPAAAAEEPPASAGDVVEIALVDLPPTLWLSAQQHHDSLLRELVLYATQHAGLSIDTAGVDAARSWIAGALRSEVARARDDGTAQRPLPSGHPSPLPSVPPRLDLRLSIPRQAGASFGALQDVLDLAEALAVEGHLLARPGLPEIIALRDWACEQVIAQLGGAPPAPWGGVAQERFETDTNAPADDSDWDASVVTGSAARIIAADDANRIVAISPPLADLLGWDPADLVGRRVVTVIPPHLREAHVAGFTRHLTTGEAHVLGVPVDLPVLCRDGREITCRFLVERAPDVVGRPIYLAAIDPVGGR